MKPIARHAVLLSASVLLQSCFTMALWGCFPETEFDPRTGESETYFEYDSKTEWSWSMFFVRVLLTPVTLTADCLTCPVQQVFLEDDEDRKRKQQSKKSRCKR